MYVAGPLVPPGVVTVTFTLPVEPTGAVAVIWVGVLPVMVALAPPNVTAVAPARLVPAMVTLEPPVVGPLVGLRPVTVGAGTTGSTFRSSIMKL